MQKGKKHSRRRWHRWLGLPLGFILVVFALSGIVLNHRHYFSSWEVNRAILPSLFQYKDWNNGFIRGSIPLPNPDIFTTNSPNSESGLSDSQKDFNSKQYKPPLEVLVYGNDGVWLTDGNLTTATPLNEGFPQGVDNRAIRSVVMDVFGDVWASTQTRLWRYDLNQGRWKQQPLPFPNERLSDLTVKGDSLIVVGRSHLFLVDLAHLKKGPDEEDVAPESDQIVNVETIDPEAFSVITVSPSEEYSQGGRQTLFRIMLKVHSGEIFGLPGRVLMDAIAVIFILMSLSGIVFYFAKKRKGCKPLTRFLFKYHKRLGIIAFILLFFMVFTGWTLRPPALIALVTSNVSLEGDNVWEDKLRNIRYDDNLDQWLLSTSDGFYRLASLEAVPEKVDAAPVVSVMGVNVWEPHGQGWLVGSFSGMYHWDTCNGIVRDYFTGEEMETHLKQGPPFGKRAVAGHFLNRPVEFYNGIDLGSMPQQLRYEPISLWNLALEVHTGRIYTFLGPVTTVFIFIFGSLILWLLISGLMRTIKKKKCIAKTEKTEGGHDSEPNTTIGEEL